MDNRFRASITALLVATAISACGDEGGVITGENTLIKGSSTSVFDAVGQNLTDINQVNFPLPEPTVGAAAPIDTSSPATSADTEDFFDEGGSLAWADGVGIAMEYSFESIAGVIMGEYERLSGSLIFSDATATIADRIANKTGCISGSIESTMQLNGSAISGGEIEFTSCQTNRLILNGNVRFNASGGSAVVLTLTGLNAIDNDSGITYDGTVVVNFQGDEAVFTTNDLNMTIPDSQRRWTQTTLTGRVEPNGERVLNGSATLLFPNSGNSIAVSVNDVRVPGLETNPGSGNLIFTHSDTSELQLSFGVTAIDELNYTVNRSDGSSITFTEQWENVFTRIPLP